MDDFIAALENMAASIQKFVGDFLERIVVFMKDAACWFEGAIERICEYFSRLFSALLRLIGALGKLSLFYIPSFIFFLIAIGASSWFSFAIAVFWALSVTMVGLYYKR